MTTVCVSFYFTFFNKYITVADFGKIITTGFTKTFKMFTALKISSSKAACHKN